MPPGWQVAPDNVLVLSGLANFWVSHSDSTSPLSQNAGQVTIGSGAIKNCLKMGDHLQTTKLRRNGFRNGGKCFRLRVTPTVGV
ncbi:MAG: hypothetical protein DMG76_09685 [Acidobacteria bacterium]|nr:MAG: hypothetical protein DMG76_09685 [Acidobacteriota bacterium]